MKVVKLLEKKIILQTFGIGLIASPFLNAVLTILQLDIAAQDRWNWTLFIHVLMTGIFFQKVLNVCSVLLGAFLLSGSVKAWRFVLAFLGSYIVVQIIYLGPNLRTNPISGLLFLINVGLFLFIADQLVWKQKVKAPLTAAAPPAPVPTKVVEFKKPITVRKSVAKIAVYFKDFGAWGYLSAISTQGIEVRSWGKVPDNIESREIEVKLGSRLHLRAKFSHRDGQSYYFAYQGLPQEQQSQLRSWIQAKVA